MAIPPKLLPIPFSLEGFEAVFNSGVHIPTFMKNTVITSVATILLQLFLMVPAAYAFAKRAFPLRGICFGIVLVAFMIPQQLTYISAYLMMSSWGIMQSLWPQILPHGANAFGIFMLRQAFKQIPDEILESAKLDNANELQIMLQIMLPMCKSTMVTLSLIHI